MCILEWRFVGLGHRTSGKDWHCCGWHSVTADVGTVSGCGLGSASNRIKQFFTLEET